MTLKIKSQYIQLSGKVMPIKDLAWVYKTSGCVAVGSEESGIDFGWTTKIHFYRKEKGSEIVYSIRHGEKLILLYFIDWAHNVTETN